MGAAWRNVKDGDEFDQVLEIVRSINKMDLEVCCTLGLLTDNPSPHFSQSTKFETKKSV
jgi:biotin synthase